MANKKSSIMSIVLIVIGVLAILPLFLEFMFSNMSAAGETAKEGFKLFDLETDGADGEFFWTLTKIGTIVAAVAGVAIAVLEVLKMLNINLGLIEKIAGLVAVVAGLVVLVCFLVFCMQNTDEMMGVKVFPSGAIGWYFAWIPAIVAGGLALKGSKE